MENGNANEYENDDKHELSPLLLIPMDEEAKNAKRSRGGKRFMALLLLVVMAAAASLTAGVHPIASMFSSLSGTERKQGESCASPWWNACGDRLSCYDNGSRRYCVPNGKENACCGWDGDEASGVDCGKDMYCDRRSKKEACIGYNCIDTGTVPTCHPNTLPPRANASFAKKGSCNVNYWRTSNQLDSSPMYLTLWEYDKNMSASLWRPELEYDLFHNTKYTQHHTKSISITMIGQGGIAAAILAIHFVLIYLNLI